MKLLNITIAALLSLSLFMACKKTPAPYVPPDGSYGLAYTKIFKPTCALSGCHAQEDHSTLGHSHGVSLAGETAYEGMVDVTPKNSLAISAGLKLIAPSDTNKSFILQKLIYNRSIHKYGAPMPGGGLTLSEKQIEFIKQWIQAGAPKSGHVADQNLLN